MVDQVVDAQDVVVAQHDAVYVGGQRPVHGPAQQGVDGVLGRPPACPQDKQGYRQPQPAIQREAEKVPGQQAQQQGGGGHRVRQGVGGGGGQGGGLDGFGQPPVEEEHPQLHPDGDSQNPRRQGGEGHRLRVEYLLQGGFAQLHPHQQDKHGHRQPGQILHAAVAEGVFLISRPPRQPEAHQGYNGGGGV